MLYGPDKGFVSIFMDMIRSCRNDGTDYFTGA